MADCGMLCSCCGLPSDHATGEACIHRLREKLERVTLSNAALAAARRRPRRLDRMSLGGEAEELREGIEKILEDGVEDEVFEDLRRLIDRVDARDSLHCLETVAAAASAHRPRSPEDREMEVVVLRHRMLDARHIFETLVREQGVEHEQEDCPEDDTCRCDNVRLVNHAFLLLAMHGEEAMASQISGMRRSITAWKTHSAILDAARAYRAEFHKGSFLLGKDGTQASQESSREALFAAIDAEKSAS